VAGLPVERRAGAPVVSLGNAVLHIVKAEDGRGPGLDALDLKVEDRQLLAQAEARSARVSYDRVVARGTRFNLVS
jgi:hypothetical protein